MRAAVAHVPETLDVCTGALALVKREELQTAELLEPV